MNREKYFNFPIQLLSGFLIDSRQSLKDIAHYAIYKKYLEAEGTRDQKMKIAFSFFDFNLKIAEEVLKKGEELYDSLPINSPKTGIRLSIYRDFFRNEKTEFEKICLLGFLALKSILGNKAYCKTANDFWLSRMDGKREKIKYKSELSPEIQKFANNYQTCKIKNALQNNWGLKTYSFFTRGFYVSFKIKKDKLISIAEEKRSSIKEKQRKVHEQKVRLEVRELLKKANPPHDL